MGSEMDKQDDEPILRNAGKQNVDRLGARLVDQTEKLQQKAQTFGRKNTGGDSSSSNKKGPAGGFDSTPIPKAPPGYTIKITFHRAENLPFADLQTLSSDPYIHAVLKTNLLKRHKQDPDLSIRIPTIHRSTNPVWNTEWVIANIPASGFYLKCRLYDEDPADHDDRLGNVHLTIPSIDDRFEGFKERKHELKKRMGSKRAYTIQGCIALLSKTTKFAGDLIMSVENLGRTNDENGGRAYTVGPLPWSRHYSPLIGRLTGTKDRGEDKDGKPGVEKYNFQALQFQLKGPVPAELYHRYVEFKPFVAGMFTDHSIRGRILNRALHHQHARIYNYDRSTTYGVYQEATSSLTKQFLDFVHYDQGGRIFTYVLTLDGLWRFTETGKEFGIDMLSKHTMHSDVSSYIAFSGEFFIRRVKQPRRENGRSAPSSELLPPADDNGNINGDVNGNGKDKDTRPKSPLRDPSYYELVIDNDSGTYRPNADLLPQLKDFMSHNLPGLRVMTLDCQKDEEKMKKLKNEQRERKKATGVQITYMQNTSMSSLSSSDVEDLDEREDDDGVTKKESRYKRELHKYAGRGKDEFHNHGHGHEHDGKPLHPNEKEGVQQVNGQPGTQPERGLDEKSHQKEGVDTVNGSA